MTKISQMTNIPVNILIYAKYVMLATTKKKIANGLYVVNVVNDTIHLIVLMCTNFKMKKIIGMKKYGNIDNFYDNDYINLC